MLALPAATPHPDLTRVRGQAVRGKLEIDPVSLLVNTVEPLITHASRECPKCMGCEGLWVLREMGVLGVKCAKILCGIYRLF